MCIRWALASSDPPWHLTDLFDEVVVLASELEVSFAFVKLFVNGLLTA